MKLIVPAQPLRLTETGAISAEYPELNERVYGVASFIADRIKSQTFHDAIDPNQIFTRYPEVSPETEVERANCKGRQRRLKKSCQLLWANRRLFDPTGYAADAHHTHLYSFLADSLRTKSVFHQFELLYKVVDYFFDPLKGSVLDSAVEAHVTTFDPTYTKAVVEQLRLLRVSVAHPKARHGHLNPQSIADERVIRDHLGKMRRLAELLAEHPLMEGLRRRNGLNAI